MKFAIFFLLCCVALATAAPQFFGAYPGFVGPAFNPYGARTLVAGPTVLNGVPYTAGWSGRYLAPGYFGTTFV